MNYLNYLKEKEQLEVINNEIGFIAYSVHELQDSVISYIKYWYVDPKHRKNKMGSKLADEMINELKKRKVSMLFCDVDTQHANPELSLQAILAYGCKIWEIKDNRYIVCGMNL